MMVLILPMVFFSTGMGLVLPHAMATALKPFPEMAGTTSSLLGFIQMSLSGLATALVGSLLQDSPAPMILCMLGACLCSALLTASIYRRYRVAGN